MIVYTKYLTLPAPHIVRRLPLAIIFRAFGASLVALRFITALRFVRLLCASLGTFSATPPQLTVAIQKPALSIQPADNR